MAKHATPLLDQLESGPWPSFVSDIKQEAAHRAANPDGLDYQIPADAPEDLLGVLELSYEEKETHWKHGGIVGVFGYGGGVIGRNINCPCALLLDAGGLNATSPKSSPAWPTSTPCVWPSPLPNTTTPSSCVTCATSGICAVPV